MFFQDRSDVKVHNKFMRVNKNPLLPITEREDFILSIPFFYDQLLNY